MANKANLNIIFFSFLLIYINALFSVSALSQMLNFEPFTTSEIVEKFFGFLIVASIFVVPISIVFLVQSEKLFLTTRSTIFFLFLPWIMSLTNSILSMFKLKNIPLGFPLLWILYLIAFLLIEFIREKKYWHYIIVSTIISTFFSLITPTKIQLIPSIFIPGFLFSSIFWILSQYDPHKNKDTTENMHDDEYTLLFAPASTDDFWEAKSLLKEISIPYKVQANISGSYGLITSRVEMNNRTELYVKKEDYARASSICTKLINRA